MRPEWVLYQCYFVSCSWMICRHWDDVVLAQTGCGEWEERKAQLYRKRIWARRAVAWVAQSSLDRALGSVGSF